MSPVGTAREANITNNADEAASRNKHAKCLPPNAGQFVVKPVVICNVTQLGVV